MPITKGIGKDMPITILISWGEKESHGTLESGLNPSLVQRQELMV